MTTAPEFWTTTQVARRCGCSRDAVRDWVRLGCNGHRLKAVFAAGSYLLVWPDVELFLAAARPRALRRDLVFA